LEEEAKYKKIDKLNDKVSQLDEICTSIFIALYLRPSLRYNILFKTVNRLNPKQKSGKDFISKPTFDAHLKHLTKKKLVEAKREGKQNVTYSLNKILVSAISERGFANKEEIEEWFANYPEFITINRKEMLATTEKSLEEIISRDLNRVLKNCLRELKNYLNYDLKIEEPFGDTEFWNFFGDRMYRMDEKSIAENCRASIKYKEKFFEEIGRLLKDKVLLRALVNKSEA